MCTVRIHCQTFRCTVYIDLHYQAFNNNITTYKAFFVCFCLFVVVAFCLFVCLALCVCVRACVRTCVCVCVWEEGRGRGEEGVLPFTTAKLPPVS